MSQDYGPSVWLGNDQIGYGGWVSDFRPRWIIVHGTAGDATIESVQRTFVTKPASDKSSTHYAVGQDGRVGQYVPESAPAWGNGPITGPAGRAVAGAGNAHDAWWDAQPIHNANPYTLSIEHCKTDSRNSSALTPAQKAASFALIKHLCEAHGIPKRVYGTATPADANGGVSGHFSMDPLNRPFCPGTYPWQDLQAYLDGNAGGQTTVVNTQGLGGGDAAEAQAENSSVAIPETYIGPQGHSIATLLNGNGLYWDGVNVRVLARAGDALKLLLDDRNALLTQLTQVKAQLAAAQQQPAADPNDAALKAALRKFLGL